MMFEQFVATCVVATLSRGSRFKLIKIDILWVSLPFTQKKIEMKLTKVTFFTETALSAQEKSGGFYNEKGH